MTGSLNTARRLTTATFLAAGFALFAGGINDNGGGVLQSAEEYNLGTGNFTFTGNLQFGRFYHTATLLQDGSVLVAGGVSPNGENSPPLAYCEVYDSVPGTFSVTGALNIARYDATANLLNDGTVLIAGGEAWQTASNAPTSTAEVYDPSTGGFSVTGSMSTARANQTSTLLPNGMVLVTGGSNSLGPLMTAELYEPPGSTPAGQNKKLLRSHP